MPRPPKPWAIMSPRGTMHALKGNPRGGRTVVEHAAHDHRNDKRRRVFETMCGQTSDYGWDQRPRKADIDCKTCKQLLERES